MLRSQPAAVVNKAAVGWLRRAGSDLAGAEAYRGRCLTLAQREEIALGRARSDSIRTITPLLGRSPSTVSRELRRNADGLGRYRGHHRACTGLPPRLTTEAGQAGSEPGTAWQGGSGPGQEVLPGADRGSAEGRVSRSAGDAGEYRNHLPGAVCAIPRRPETGPDQVFENRPVRKPGQRKNRIPNMINISERPAEADDRAVPGHWEGDLIIGRKNLSAVGTLVERTTNYTMLLHLPDGYTLELVREALAVKIKTLPEVLRASLTWDQGPEMGKWNQVAVDADIDIFFCDPHAPWQRATNENTMACCGNIS